MTWQDPYGQYGQNPYGQNPYGQGGYGAPQQQGWQQGGGPGWQDPYAGQQGYGYYGPPSGGGRPASNGSAIGALICNIVAAVLCCGGIAWLPGIILSAVALNRTQTDPESARNLTVWAWVCFAIDIVLAIVLVVVLYALGKIGSGNSTGTY